MDPDSDPSVIGHGDGGVDFTSLTAWFGKGLRGVQELLDEHHAARESPEWTEILGVDSPLLWLAEPISEYRSHGDGNQLFKALGIEESSEYWGGDMPGYGGYYVIAHADGKTRQNLRTGFRRLEKAIRKWNMKRNQSVYDRASNTASLDRLRDELRSLESESRDLESKRSSLKRKIKEAERVNSIFEAQDALAALDAEAKRLCTLARNPENRFHLEGTILIDPNGLIWRLYGDTTPAQSRYHSEDLVDAIRRRRKRVIDVFESYAEGREPPRGMAKAHFTWEGWKQDRSKLRFATKQRKPTPDPEIVRQQFLDWCKTQGIELPPTRPW